MGVLKARDPAKRNKEIAALRKRVGIQLDVGAVFEKKMTSEQQEKYDRMTQYVDFRRAENERQLEVTKALLFEYMFNPQVDIRETVIENGEIRTVAVSQFDAMCKATTLFLATMNIQNKLWGLYDVPSSSKNGHHPTIKNLTVFMVDELQKMAKRPSLPAANGRVIGNGQ